MITLQSIDAAQLGATAAAIYTCPAYTRAKDISLTVCNDTTTAVTFTLYKVPSGGSVGDDNILVNAETLGSRESKVVEQLIGQILEAGDAIHGLASVASQVTYSGGVLEKT